MERVIREIRRYKSFLVVSHINPDGDSICSLLTFGKILDFFGKEGVLYSPHPVPLRLSFLPEVERIETRLRAEGYEEIVSLDTPLLSRTGELPKGVLINIDHHPSNSHFGRINWVEPKATATCELLYYLIREIGMGISKEVSTYLYTGIYTETGGFVYPNTKKEIMVIATRLLDYGVDPVEVARRVSSLTVEGIKLLSQVLQGLEFNDGIASIYLTKEMQELFRTPDSQADDFIKFPLLLNRVKLALFFREEKPGLVRVSLRSLGEVDVNRLAQKLGGGGHKTAAGLRLKMDLERAKEEVLRVAKRFLE